MIENEVSVVLPVYNGMPYLPEAVDSILGQSHSKIKLFIINDGSTDGTKKYLNTIKDKRVLVFHQNNVGLGETLNRLVALTDTKYIARMDSDDISKYDRIEKQVELLSSDDDLVLVGTGIHFVVGNVEVKSGEIIVSHDDIVNRLWKKKFSVCHPSIMFKRDAFTAVGGYKVKGAGEDLDFFLRMSEIGKLSNVSEDLFGYRIGNISLSAGRRQSLHLGYDYALSCAKNRRDNILEESFDDFSKRWRTRSGIKRVFETFDDLSEKLYRKYIVSKASGLFVVALCYLSIAAILRPHTVIDRVILRIKSI